MIPTVFRFWVSFFWQSQLLNTGRGPLIRSICYFTSRFIHTSSTRTLFYRVLLVPTHVAPYESFGKEKRRTVLSQRATSGPTGTFASRQSIYCHQYAPSHVHSFLGTSHTSCHGGVPGPSFDPHTHVHTCTLRNPSAGMETQDNTLGAPVLQPQPLDINNSTDPEGDDRVRAIPQTCSLRS